MDRWYKDRDFPEVKASNADIVAVIERPKELARVIKEHNELIDYIWELEHENKKLKEEAKMWKDRLDLYVDIDQKLFKDRHITPDDAAFMRKIGKRNKK